MYRIKPGINDDLHRDTLYHFDKITRRILRGQQAEDRAGPGLHTIDMALKGHTRIGINPDLNALTHGHFLDLRLLEIGYYPCILLYDCKKGLARAPHTSRDQHSSWLSFPRWAR